MATTPEGENKVKEVMVRLRFLGPGAGSFRWPRRLEWAGVRGRWRLHRAKGRRRGRPGPPAPTGHPT
ncbi:MAG: hypothetical protein ACK53Y_25480, partial [bacterium]